MKLVGKIMLLVTGIIFLAIGIWGIVTSGLAVSGAVKALLSNKTEENIAVLIGAGIALAIAVLLMLFYLFAGIRGIKSFTKGDHKNVTKAFIWAIVILVFNVGGFIASKSFVPSNLAGLLVDAVYIVGAFFVKLSK